MAYSGGKDSSALLKLVFLALLRSENRSECVTVVYSNTGVEIPVIKWFALDTLRNVSAEAQKRGVPICTRIVAPRPSETFFARVIGRGYPPPTYRFRWCSDRLLIRPVQEALESGSDAGKTLLLGTRHKESSARNQSISEHATEREYFFHQGGNSDTLIYSPIVDYTTEQVWATLMSEPIPRSMEADKLLELYGGRDSKRRFGCWTCTVVRRDRATEGLISDGHTDLLPLLEFRNWLLAIRDRSVYRCDRRRNGDAGKGPFTLAARREILERLLRVQRQSGFRLITEAELKAIGGLWRRDRLSPGYVEKEGAS